MSVEDAKKFIEKVNADADFREKLASAKTKEDRMKIAEGEGFSFTVDEFEKASSELSDADLAQVAGGWGGHCGYTHESEAAVSAGTTAGGDPGGWPHGGD